MEEDFYFKYFLKKALIIKEEIVAGPSPAMVVE
jgi:hypothetical protein